MKDQWVALIIIGNSPVANEGAKFDRRIFNKTSINNRPIKTFCA